MLTRGIFHAVTDDDLKQLRRAKDGPMRRNLILEWDERWPEELRCGTDKAWKLLSVALAFHPGTRHGRFEVGRGLGIEMFYAKSLHRSEFYVISLVDKEALSEIVPALESLDEEKFRAVFYAPESQESFTMRNFSLVHGIDSSEARWCDYSWEWLQKIRVLFRNALEDGRSVVFSAHNC